MMSFLCIACLAGLLVVGALIDIDSRRLPNWLTSSVAALYGLFVVVSPVAVDWTNAFVVAGLVFAIGFACFAFGLMGGGDVKLMAGLALWAGVDHIALFLIVTSLAGGLLSVIMLMRHRLANAPLLLLLWPLSDLIARKLQGPATVAGSPSPVNMAESDLKNSLPYGVAIAAGGFAVIYALLQN